ncbi:NfeD family protein [Rhodoferax sp.]|uniref:NfeD family protein n=1 Tax=Rhodoferax sp. TaxID=50421 RepID=UPI002ACEB59B|nr:NfeD family protein [Rhodoferax sp.]MDZ7919771.1 NfeD family protein [Rhodoferax sp.]
MSQPTLWWLVTGAIVAVELLTGTFYLLMLGLGAVAAALAAHMGASLTVQVVLASLVGGGAVVIWHFKRSASRAEAPAQANPNVNLDIGETVQVASWNADGTASVHYRGAQWTVMHRAGINPAPGAYRVAEMVGNRLLVDKA